MALGYLISPFIQVEDINGKPLVGGRIRVYRHGTQIPYITYKDWNGDRNPSEVRLDAKGSCILIADDENLYDVYCEDANYVEQWSRLNVSVGGGAGSGSGTVITSTDGSVVITRVGDTVDLSVADAVPSAIVAQSEARNGNGPFIFTSEPINITGDDISLTGARITCKKRWYHYDATVQIDWQGTPRNNVIELTISGPDCYERVSFDLSFPHSEWITLSADYQIQHNGDRISLGISGMDLDGFDLVGLSAMVTNASVHTIVGRGQSSGGSFDIFTDETLSGDGTAESPLSVVGAPFQEPLVIYNGCGISIVDNVIEADVWTDTTLNGAGTSASPLGVAEGSIGRQQLATSVKDDIDSKISSVVTDGVTITGSGVAGDPLVAVGGGSPTYTAGDAIDLTNDEIAVKYGDGLGLDGDGALEVKVGDGLSITDDGGIKVITVDSDVSDVVATVEKLKKDLDTQITVNFDQPNISQVYDFADPSTWLTPFGNVGNTASMLFQSFTIPINHDIRTLTDDSDLPTLLGIYAKQSFGHKIMLALYEYTYAGEGEEHGSSTYVGDTGPVNVLQGLNEYPLKNRNPSIKELRSDKLYYATLYLPSTALVNGLYLAGCPSYGNASVPSEPRLSCNLDNILWQGQELDMSDPTTTLNHYQTVVIPGEPDYLQYFIGPWSSGYHECWGAPRFYLQIRNGAFNEVVPPTAPFNTLGDALPHGTLTQTDIPSFSPSTENSAFRDVTPALNVTITAFEWIDGMSTCAGWAPGNCVFDSGFATNMSGLNNSVVDLGQVVTGQNPGYGHRITFTTPLALSAGVTYRFLCGCTNGSPYFKVWLDPTDVIHFGNNGWYIDPNQNLLRTDHHAGMYNKLYDNQNNHYVI